MICLQCLSSLLVILVISYRWHAVHLLSTFSLNFACLHFNFCRYCIVFIFIVYTNCVLSLLHLAFEKFQVWQCVHITQKLAHFRTFYVECPCGIFIKNNHYIDGDDDGFILQH